MPHHFEPFLSRFEVTTAAGVPNELLVQRWLLHFVYISSMLCLSTPCFSSNGRGAISGFQVTVLWILLLWIFKKNLNFWILLQKYQ